MKFQIFDSFPPVYFVPEIALYSTDNVTVEDSYSYISPCEYYNIGDLLKQPKPKPSSKAKKPSKENEVIYELIQNPSQIIGAESNPTYRRLSETISTNTPPVIPKKPSFEQTKTLDEDCSEENDNPPPLIKRTSIVDSRGSINVSTAFIQDKNTTVASSTKDQKTTDSTISDPSTQEFQKMASREKVSQLSLEMLLL